MAVSQVPADQLATVVTTLEMRRRPRPAPLPTSSLRLARWSQPHPQKYRALFYRVGAPWLWYSRLAMDDATLRATIGHPQTEVHAVIDPAGIEVGLLEFSHPETDWCALDYFGLVPELAGKRHGQWLMALALPMMWRPGVNFVRVNTCTLDHPAALRFYLAHGFVAVSRAVETFPDPRVTGLVAPGAAPQIPLLAAIRR